MQNQVIYQINFQLSLITTFYVIEILNLNEFLYVYIIYMHDHYVSGEKSFNAFKNTANIISTAVNSKSTNFCLIAALVLTLFMITKSLSPYKIFPSPYSKSINQLSKLSDTQFQFFCYTNVRFQGYTQYQSQIIELDPRLLLKKK